MTSPDRSDVEDVAVRVAAALEGLGVRYLVGGSVASSLMGEPRATNDIDFLVEMTEGHVPAFASALGSDFSIDEESLREAIRRRRSWNIFYLPLVTKIDLFIKRENAFDESELMRRRFVPVTASGTGFYVASPEDIVLQKLVWFRAGGEKSDAQWRDVLGVVAISGENLDHVYLLEWADSLGVEDLLRRVVKGSALNRVDRKPKE